MQKAIQTLKDEPLKFEILRTIKSLQPSLMQLKHGQKVVYKLSKQFPEVFMQPAFYPDQASSCSSQSSMSANSHSFVPKRTHYKPRQGAKRLKTTGGGTM